MNPGLKSALDAMIEASDGKVWLVSGDRDTATQTTLWNEAVAKYGPDEARQWVAPPGHSQHEKGEAVDLGGDLAWVAANAHRFGLVQPMEWEPWHWELSGSRSSDPMAYTEHVEDAVLTGPKGTSDPFLALMRMLGMPSTEDITGGVDPIFQSKSTDPAFAKSVDTALYSPIPIMRQPAPSPIARPNQLLDRLMAAIRMVESSGDYRAVGVPTPWGRATGAYQFLDSTWGNYGGYARAADAPPDVQDENARRQMQGYLDQFGSPESVAAAWFSGPAGNWESAEVQEYIGKVMSAMGAF